MEIGPIPGIRAIQPVQSSRAANDLSGVFRVEFQREQQDHYAPHSENSERGIEDEDESGESESPDGEPIRASSDDSGDRQVSFFA